MHYVRKQNYSVPQKEMIESKTNDLYNEHLNTHPLQYLETKFTFFLAITCNILTENVHYRKITRFTSRKQCSRERFEGFRSFFSTCF